jgi:hypothetical protein
MWWLPHGKTKHLALTGPFRGQVGETGKSHTVREPSINGRLDEVGREEGERDCLLILRTLQPSRPAMVSVLDWGSVMSSLSQRRPRAIDATSSARLSERMGRASVAPDTGTSTSRRRVDGVLRHGTSIT